MSSETVTSLGQLSVEVEAVTEVGRTQGKGKEGERRSLSYIERGWESQKEESNNFVIENTE